MRTFLLGLVFLLIASCFDIKNKREVASIVDSCESLIKSLLAPDHEVGIIWFPTGAHAELRVGKRVYSTIGRPSSGNTMEAVSRFSQSKNGRASYYFGVKVSPEEFEELDRLIWGTPDTGLRTCIGGACYLIKQTTGYNPVPPPFNQSPFLSAAIMKAKHLLGSKRIHTIEYMGRSQMKRFDIGLLAAAGIESSIVLGSGLFITTVVVVGGDTIYNYFYIPIYKKINESDE